jgi:hypothetical protein
MPSWKILSPQDYSLVLRTNNYTNRQKEINLVLWWDGDYIPEEQGAKLDIREWEIGHPLSGNNRRGVFRGITFDKNEAEVTVEYLNGLFENNLIGRNDIQQSDEIENIIRNQATFELSRDTNRGVKNISMSLFSGSIKCDIRYWVENNPLQPLQSLQPTQRGITLDKDEAKIVIEYFNKALEESVVWDNPRNRYNEDP